MRKSKILALTLVVAVMLVGAGYAYWTDQLTINNTVTTGKLDVHFTGQNTTRGGDDQTGKNAAGQNLSYWGAYVNHEGLVAGHGGPATTITDNGKTVNTQVTNMYPGAYAQYYGTIENDGTIPAVFDNATVTFTGADKTENLSKDEQSFRDNLKFAFGYVITDENGVQITPNSNSGDGRYWTSGTMSEFQSKLTTLLNGVRLEPGQKLSLDFPSEADAQAAMASIGYPYNSDMHCITYTLSTAALDNVENQTLGIHITINWKQHNAK